MVLDVESPEPLWDDEQVCVLCSWMIKKTWLFCKVVFASPFYRNTVTSKIVQQLLNKAVKQSHHDKENN